MFGRVAGKVTVGLASLWTMWYIHLQDSSGLGKGDEHPAYKLIYTLVWHRLLFYVSVAKRTLGKWICAGGFNCIGRRFF